MTRTARPMNTGNRMPAVYLLPLVLSAAACIVGVVRANTRAPDWPVMLGVLGCILLTGVVLAGARDPDVADGDFVLGVVVGATLLAGLPLLVYYWLGRSFAKRRLVLAFVYTLDLVQCPPEAYECPM
jgi:hypothetical protein